MSRSSLLPCAAPVQSMRTAKSARGAYCRTVEQQAARDFRIYAEEMHAALERVVRVFEKMSADKLTQEQALALRIARNAITPKNEAI